MKHLILSFLCVVMLMASCASFKKEASTVRVSHSVDSTASSENVIKKSFFDFDTTFAKDVGITFTEMEFYPPIIEDCEDANGMQVQKKPSNGGVKRMKRTTIRTSVREARRTKKGDTLSMTRLDAQTRKNDNTAFNEQTVTKRTYHWWYYVVIISAVALLYLARTPILNVIRKILASVRCVL